MQVLMERTLFPFYLGCLDGSAASRLAMQVCENQNSPICYPRLAFELQTSNRFGMECVECKAATIAQTGRRCSLTYHCLPFLTRCPLHGCLFRVTDPCSSRELKMRTSGNRARRRNNACVGTAAAQLLSCTSSHSALDWLQFMLYERRYQTDEGKIRLAPLEQDVRSIFSEGFEDERLNLWLFRKGLVGNAIRYFAAPKYASHPSAVGVLLAALPQIEYSSKSHARAGQ
ncbi:hypothetical protein R75777_07559 [Paraburkholderia nemoris]|nr:hypothetical protein R75777_07559 [Paraburkholderia nemoris]